MNTETRQIQAAKLLILASFTALMGATWFRHTDVGDAQLYRTVTRHMLEDDSWVHLRYLVGAGTPFFDHLPFAFWPLAVTWKLFGEGALIPLCALLSLLTVWLAGEIARKLAGEWAGVAAMFVLATTEKFFFQTSYPTLDPLLHPFATGAALVFLTGRYHALTGLLAVAAVGIKGPFGLVPLFGVVVARALVDRSLKALLWGALIAAVAILPTYLFLRSSETWWKGYVLDQLLASADGSRTDGRMYHLHNARVIAGRFWPWFPLTVPAALLAIGKPERAVRWLAPEDSAKYIGAARFLGIATFAMVFALCLPSRQIWHHTLVAYPVLSAFCAIAVAPRLTLWLRSASARRRLLAGLGALVLACLVADVAGLEAVLMNKPCVLGNELAAPLAQLAPGTALVVVGEDFDILSCLAAEKRLEPRLAPSLQEAPAAVRWALYPQLPSAPDGWKEIASARGWTLASRT